MPSCDTQPGDVGLVRRATARSSAQPPATPGSAAAVPGTLTDRWRATRAVTSSVLSFRIDLIASLLSPGTSVTGVVPSGPGSALGSPSARAEGR